jgi:signal transduction histidine kinase
MILIGVWEGMIASVLVAGANVATLFVKIPRWYDGRANPSNQPIPISLEVLQPILMVLIFSLAVYIITNTATAVTSLQNELLEEAVARANTANLTELQNRVKAVYRVARTLNRTLDYRKVIEDILIELETVFDISAGAVLLFDERSNLRVEDGLRLSPTEQTMIIGVLPRAIREVVMKGEPTLVTDKESLEEIYSLFPSIKGCPSAVVMPMRGGYEVFGLVLIASRQENAYNAQDLEWIVALTSHPIIALQNAKLYQSLMADRNKMIRDVEEVRHTLARNLHDGPAQAVAAFSMQAEFIRRLIKNDPDKAVEEVSSLGKQAIQTSKEIRTLLFELRPLALESQGLDAALEQYASRFPMNPDDPKVHFSANNFSGRVAPNVETTVFTVLQESINNARKHAKAQNMWLNLEIKGGYIIASAQDDGKGFDVKAMEANPERRHSLGMTNMRERAALVNGTVQVDSVPGRGTIIILKIPLNEENTTIPPNLTTHG